MFSVVGIELMLHEAMSVTYDQGDLAYSIRTIRLSTTAISANPPTRRVRAQNPDTSQQEDLCSQRWERGQGRSWAEPYCAGWI